MRFLRWVSVKVEKGRDAPHTRRYVLILLLCFILLLIVLTLLLILRAHHL
ncbi:MAG: hypothetical protein GXO10_05260 [Crenarchaeota archaeon]|nr:hypothetical protein [Thermoproteota archaeon]